MSLSAPRRSSQAAAPAPAAVHRPGPRAGRANRGLARSARLYRLFLGEQTDPDRFYGSLAEDAVSQLEEYCTLGGRVVIDVGGGAGHLCSALRARGALCCLVEPDPAELLGRGGAPPGALLADGCALPVRDGSADVCFASNVLEHVPDPVRLIDELARATRPGGLIYLSFTNWYSPHGGHEMAPWHLLGPHFAERRYLRRHGRAPKHHVGSTLFAVHVGPVLRLLRSRHDVEIVDARPRYYPPWAKAVLKVPGLREIATWNLLIILRRAT